MRKNERVLFRSKNDNGGVVSLGRVGGVLALSRAFGDFQFKKNNFVYHKSIPQEQQVSVEPDVIVHEIDYNKDEFLVLACDGIWDVYSNRNLVQFVRYHLALNIKFDEIVRKLLDRGISCADSNTGAGFDNMTVMLVALNKPNESHEYWYSRIKNRLEREKRIV
ncbi:uncharacterized protein SCODWIG_02185 [Saccharomycodes ludwigii]|uniref:protein-serine/threonine phosphatase n=1 Tax=Saccharomycodes ludwigii TaxID=36035 RepID=A0A376B7H1_9ASCO|nr:uncharacterized protein SCODWIG_02185 [Saccharomycodes ludwigii]